MKDAARTYHKQLAAAIVAYTIILFASIALLNRFPDAAWRVPVALAPMLPALFIPLAVARFLGRMDEMQRQIQLEALGFAFGGTAVLTFGYGFLQNVGFPQASWFFVWPIMAILWLLGLAIASRKYR